MTAASSQLVRDQHTVSRCVLKRFAERGPSGLQVQEINLGNGISRPRSIKRAGVTEHFVEVDSAATENLWAEVENDLPRAIDAAAAGRLEDHPELIDVLRSAIALHYVRCDTTYAVMRRVQADVVPKVIRNSVQARRADFVREFPKRMSGLLAAGDEALEFLAHRMSSEAQETFQSAAYRRQRIVEIYEKARAIARTWPLEIVTAAEGEFIIGDVPVVTTRPGAHGHGMESVALGDARQIVMPLAPTLAVSVGPSAVYGQVGADIVDELNRRQIVTARARVFHRPSIPHLNSGRGNDEGRAISAIPCDVVNDVWPRSWIEFARRHRPDFGQGTQP